MSYWYWVLIVTIIRKGVCGCMKTPKKIGTFYKSSGVLRSFLSDSACEYHLL